MAMALDTMPGFPLNTDAMLAALAHLFANQGNPLEVAILATATPAVHFEEYDNYNGGTFYHKLELQIPLHLYVQVAPSRAGVEDRIMEQAHPLLVAYSHHRIAHVVITPSQQVDTSWRHGALAWLAGSGVTNQGRVRSDNIASRECDGLHFRSEPEIYLYKALKALGVSFAPLPVFVRGGDGYRRIEPDFVILNGGLAVVVKVDGDTVHTETPAEAYDRTTMLEHEGAHVIRVKASECSTPEAATMCAKKLMTTISKFKAAR